MAASAASEIIDLEIATVEERALTQQSFKTRPPQATLRSLCELVGEAAASMGVTYLAHKFTRMWPNAIR